MNSDFTVDLKSNHLTVHSIDHDEDWEVTVAYTGEHTMTGGRIAKAAQKYLGNAPHAAITYGDGLANIDLSAEYDFHLAHGKIGTLLGVNPPSRFGEINLQGNSVVEFSEKPEFKNNWVNGGFFFFKREFFTNYLQSDENLVLEKAPLIKLAKDRQLEIFKHSGFWACMDTQRDRDALNDLWNSGQAPWAPNFKFTPLETQSSQTVKL
jgi:glucose-1-phosphate cytidylyltransferase